MPLPTKLETVLPLWQEQLQAWAADGSLASAARHALELEGEKPFLDELVAQWAAGDFSALPPIVLLPASSMPRAAGAYAISTGTIYLNQDWLETASDAQVVAVLTEELGHHLDALLNKSDTPGDEGELFAAAVSGGGMGRQPILVTPDDDAIQIQDKGELLQAEAAAIAPPSTPDLSPDSDTGISDTDDLTADNTPSFSGTAEPGSAVELLADGSSLGSTTANNNGNWLFTVPDASALPDGSTGITAVASTGSTTAGAPTLQRTANAPASPGRTHQEVRNNNAFAVLKNDGSVITWGFSDWGGDSSSVADKLQDGVTQIFSNGSDFAALKDNGSVVTWGDYGGNSSSVAAQLQSGVVSFADPFHDDRLIPATSGSGLTSEPSPALAITIDTTAPVFASSSTAAAIDENSGVLRPFPTLTRDRSGV